MKENRECEDGEEGMERRGKARAENSKHSKKPEVAERPWYEMEKVTINRLRSGCTGSRMGHERRVNGVTEVRRCTAGSTIFHPPLVSNQTLDTTAPERYV